MSKTAPRKLRKPETRRKTLLELEQSDCRWPIGEPRQPDFRFCAERSLEGRPYCALHWSMAFQPPRPRHQAPAAVAAVPPATAKAA
jgi:GcrA cell cycle regulator